VAVTEPIWEHDLEEETAVPLRLDLAEYDSNVTLALDTFPDLNEITRFHPATLPFYLTTRVGPLHEIEEVDMELFLEFTLIDEVYDHDTRLGNNGPDSQDEDDLPTHDSDILESGKVTRFQ
jgi:hypothetical protein